MKWVLLAVTVAGGCGEPPWPRVVPDPAPPDAPVRVTEVASARSEDAGRPSTESLDEEALAALAPILAENDKIHAALVADTLAGVAAAAGAVASAAQAARAFVKDEALVGYLSDIEKSAAKVGSSDDIEVVRAAYGDLSKPMVALASAVPAVRGARKVFFCPMTKGYPKWLQAEPSLRNPYYGSKMLTCGEESEWSE